MKWLTIFLGGILWAQMFPDVDNHVAEVRITELSQSGGQLKVTVQNVSAKTIRSLSITLGRHRVDKDWSAMPGGGLGPNASGSMTISTAGLRSGGTRHHPEPPGPLEVLTAVFTDGSAATPPPAVAQEAPPAKLRAVEASPAAIAGKPEASKIVPPPAKPEPAVVNDTVRRAGALEPLGQKPEVREIVPPPAKPEPAVVTDTIRRAGALEPLDQKREAREIVPPPAKPEPVVVTDTVRRAGALEPLGQKREAREIVPPPAKPEPVVVTEKTVRPAGALEPLGQKPQAPEIVAPTIMPAVVETIRPTGAETKAEPAPAKVVPILIPPPPPVDRTPSDQEPEKPKTSTPRSGIPGTNAQGRKAELARLISLVQPFEPELAGYPRQALRKMDAALVKEQNEMAAVAPVTDYDQGQRSAMQAFAYGLQWIKDRRDLDEDALRDQVARFLKTQRQAAAKP